jgi:hypothetical protein
MIPEPDIDMTLTMPWRTICALACMARVRGCSIEALVVEALRARLDRRSA